MPRETSERERLELRLAALMHEVRSYPTPIARCDLHLPALLEERAAVLEQLRRLDTTPPGLQPRGKLDQ